MLHTILIKLLRGEGLLRTLALAFTKRDFFAFVSGMEGNEVICDASVSFPLSQHANILTK